MFCKFVYVHVYVYKFGFSFKYQYASNYKKTSISYGNFSSSIIHVKFKILGLSKTFFLLQIIKIVNPYTDFIFLCKTDNVSETKLK